MSVTLVAASKAPRLATGTLGATTGLDGAVSIVKGSDAGVASVHAAGVDGTGLFVLVGQAVAPSGSDAVPEDRLAESTGLAHAASGPELLHSVVPLGRLSPAAVEVLVEGAVQALPEAQAGRIEWMAATASSGAGAAASATVPV